LLSNACGALSTPEFAPQASKQLLLARAQRLTGNAERFRGALL